MDKTKIDWATASWNPITGCLHGCEYCYAREMAKRFGTRKNAYWDRDQGCINHWNGVDMPVLDSPIMFMAESEDGDGCSGFPIAVNPYPVGFTPTFHRYHLAKPQHWKKPRNIFTVSMGDMFGDWVPDDRRREIFDACDAAPWHNYLFLTKNPAGIERAIDNYACEDRGSEECYQFFDNFWFGTTITKQADIDHLKILSELEEAHRFISIEPLMGRIELDLKKSRCPLCGSQEIYEDNPTTTPKGVKPVYCDCCGEWESNSIDNAVPDIGWVIIGAETGNRWDKVIPRREWVTDIVDQCRAAGVPVFLKGSLAGIWGEPLIQEYPQELIANAHSG